MEIKKLFSVSQFILFFQRLLFPIKPIEDKAILNLLNEKIKKIGLTPSKIGFLRGKSKIKGLSQIIVLGDVRVKNEIVIIVSEDLFHEISDFELEAHLAIAIAESQYTYQAKYNFINVLPAFFLFLNLAIQTLVRPYIPAEYFILFYSFFNLVFLISLIASFFIIERLKQIGTYVSAMHHFNIKLETVILLKDNFLKKSVKFPILVTILTWLKFLSPNQIQKLKKLIEDEAEFDFLYMLKAFFKNPIILINIFTMLITIVISLFK